MATKAMEVVTVKNVSTNNRGWHEIEVAEYDEPLVTKEPKLKVAAQAALDAGKALEVDVNVKQNGDFTNRYLNAVGGTAEASAEALAAPSKRDERAETQARIQAQWAIGRAIELHAASGGDLGSLMDTETFGRLTTVAESLLTASKALAEKS